MIAVFVLPSFKESISENINTVMAARDCETIGFAVTAKLHACKTFKFGQNLCSALEKQKAWLATGDNIALGSESSSAHKPTTCEDSNLNCCSWQRNNTPYFKHTNA